MISKIKIFVLAALTSFATAVLSQPSSQGGKLDYALDMIKYAYVDTVNEKKLSDASLKAMLKELDPHSVYISQEEMREMNEPLVGKFDGIGIQFNILKDTIMVAQTIPGGPSEKLGIRAGDRIIKIDGVNKAGVKITTNDVLKLLRGTKGTKVTVSIKRRDVPDLIDFTITRDQIPLFSVDATYMVTPKIGYIKISRFADATVDEFKKALEPLKAKGIESLILDLQGNGGGYLNRAVELADEFLSSAKKIVYTRGRNTPAEDYNSTPIGGWEKGKLAILIDEGSASASEIVSGAVQDWDRGLVIGRRSFGKGLVQKPYQFPDGSMLRLTIAHYYTPSGRCIQKPYKLGEEDEYEQDYYNRYKHGELLNPDSIHFEDSVKYFTNNKRLVHGGGGIMPDLFVPLDTIPFTNFYSDLQRKNTFNDFILTYVDNNRNQLKKDYPQLEDFKKNFSITDKFFNDFLTNAEKLGSGKDSSGAKLYKQVVADAGKNNLTLDTVPLKKIFMDADKERLSRSSAELKRSESFIRLQLKALIARELWKVEGYFEVINEANHPLQKAIEAIQNNTFEKMKIAEK